MMRNPIRLGNKAALIVGILFFIADTFPLFHEFGAWIIGCLFCFYYSASAISQEERASKRLKYSLYGLLFLLLVAAILVGVYLLNTTTFPFAGIDATAALTPLL